MKNFGLKQNTMLKLSLLVLMAVSIYPSTKGNNIKDKESDPDSKKIIDELKPYDTCLSGFSVRKTLRSCIDGEEGSVRASAAEEECKKALTRNGICFTNALDTCGVSPSLRATYINYLNRKISTMDCLKLVAKNW